MVQVLFWIIYLGGPACECEPALVYPNLNLHRPKTNSLALKFFFIVEHMLELFFHRGHLVASHCRRKSLKKEDLALGEVLSCEDKVQRSLTECQEKMRSEALHLEKTLRQQKKRQIRDVQAPKIPPSAKRARSPMEWRHVSERFAGVSIHNRWIQWGQAEVNLTTRLQREKSTGDKKRITD